MENADDIEENVTATNADAFSSIEIYGIEENVTEDNVSRIQTMVETEDVGNVVEDISRNLPPNDIKDFLAKIQLEDLVDLFETEMIDLNVLEEMNHEDLKSIGITRFGQRHKLLKEIGKFKLIILSRL